MRNSLSNNKAQKGQAAIEFLVSVVVIFFFLLFYLSICILMVTSEYMDYATFMAARTYKSAYGSEASQEANARVVFDAYTNNVQGIARNIRLNFTEANPGDPKSAGVEAYYDIDMFYLPPVFIGADAPPSRIRLTAEAHLGREPGFQDCENFFTSFVRQLNIPNMEQFASEMDDNGC